MGLVITTALSVYSKSIFVWVPQTNCLRISGRLASRPAGGTCRARGGCAGRESGGIGAGWSLQHEPRRARAGLRAGVTRGEPDALCERRKF